MDTINTYMKELKNNNSTQSHTVILFQQYKNGCQKAKDELISNYLLLVVKIARSYMNKGVDLADLISEGNVGLIKAVEKYDATKGAFSSYASTWIKQSIIRNCMMNKRVVRLPENISNLMATDRWSGVNYREISIDTPNDEGDSMADDIPDTESAGTNPFYSEESMIMKNKIERILSFLQGRDAEIVKACYGIDREKPLEVFEAAELFNLSTTRINQILRSSLKKMRISHNHLPESETKEVEIVNAKYGIDNKVIDVTDKVNDLYMSNENVKASNRLGGDPCPGVGKILTIQYIYNETLLTKTFSEGSVIKF
jgi:RNA polymerase primary sigma factor